eukprot:UN01124
MNEEEDERDEYDDQSQCMDNKLIFDIMTTTLDTHTNKIFSAKLTHHSFKITPVKMKMKMSCKNNDFIAPEMPRLFLSVSALKSPQMVRAFKETVIGTQFARTHGLTALIMSFVGIVAFAATNANTEAQFVEIM